MWSHIVEDTKIAYQPAVILSGAEPNDDSKAIKREIIQRANYKGHRVSDDAIEIKVREL